MEGAFAADFTEKKVMFSPHNVRYIRFVSLNDANNSGFTRVAELNVLAPAKIYRVNKTEDTVDGVCDVDCSLREAVIAANARIGLDMIQLSGDVMLYELTLIGRGEEEALTGDFDITDDLVVAGDRDIPITVDGIGKDRIFHVMQGVTTVLSGLHMTNGQTNSNFQAGTGGAILNAGGQLVIEDSFFSNNIASGYGGAIENRLDIFDERGFWTGIDPPSSLIVRRSNFSGNCGSSGGAIENGGNLFIVDTVFSDNQPIGECSSSDGAAIHIQYGERVDIKNSTFRNNQGGTGAISIWDGLDINIQNSSIFDNVGTSEYGAGGIDNWAGTVSITNTTIANNQGERAGGLYNGNGMVTVKNSTIAYNRSNTKGGGIYAQRIRAFALDDTGAIVYSAIKLENSLVMSNEATLAGSDCFTDNGGSVDPGSAILSLGHNLISNLEGIDSVSGNPVCDIALQTGDVESAAPVLDFFSDDSTPGKGHYPLLANSIAIDAANNANCPARDQLGRSRPQDGDLDLNPVCDIGAIEYPFMPQQCATTDDIDCDGLSDAWEVQYFGDLSRNGNSDFDGDGITDRQEYLDGSDPVAAAVQPISPVAMIDTPSNGIIITVGESLLFSGSGTDPDGDDGQLRYTWDFGGTGALPLTGTGTSPGNVQFTAAGTYTVELVVTDESGLSSPPFTVNVTVTAQAVNSRILDVRINNASDDAEENNSSGSMYLTSSDLELVRDTADQMVGMRFTEIDIPQGATINTAYVQFTVDETSSVVTSLRISGEATHDATPFSNTIYNISARTETTANVTWTPPAWNTVGAAGINQRTPELSSIIQEIVDQAGWSSGQALALLVNGTGKRVAESYNGSRTKAPLLHVEYSMPGGGDTNRAPIVSGNSLITNENTPVTATLVATDPDGDTLGYSIVTPPTQGEVIIDDILTGTYTYTPNMGATGTDRFTFKANDGTLDSNMATVTVTINSAGETSGTVNVRIASGADDAEEHIDGNIELASSDLELVYDSYTGMAAGNQKIGLRFTGVAIPQGATIDKAYIQFKVDEKTATATNLTLTGQAIDNAPAFSTAAYDISSRAVTASYINWMPAMWSTVGVAGVEQRTPELKAVIQEIVDRGGWVNGNALALMITGTGERVAESYDGDATGAALLHVEYTILP